MKIQLANPRGFCAGVDRAIEIVKRALEIYGAPVYVLHEIVHNKHVLEDLSARGTVFVKSLSEVPPGSVTVFSAHGVSEMVVAESERLGLKVIDATCPLVTKVHVQANQYAEDGREVLLIGHEGHPEVEGTRGRIPGKVHVLCTVEEVEALKVANPDQLAYVTQTTLSVDDTREVVDALRERFPSVKGPDLRDICYATQNRQNAVKTLLPEVDALVVVGSSNSSNSNRLRELGERSGVPSFLIDDPTELCKEWFEGKSTVGVTAGASAPEALVSQILDRLQEFGVSAVHEFEGSQEQVVFQLPDDLEAYVE